MRRVEAPVDQAQQCFGGQIEGARHRLIGERVEFDGVMNGEKEVALGRRRVNVYIEDTALRLACVRNELCQGVDQQRHRIGRDLCGRVERDCDVPAVHRMLGEAHASKVADRDIHPEHRDGAAERLVGQAFEPSDKRVVGLEALAGLLLGLALVP